MSVSTIKRLLLKSVLGSDQVNAHRSSTFHIKLENVDSLPQNALLTERSVLKNLTQMPHCVPSYITVTLNLPGSDDGFPLATLSSLFIYPCTIGPLHAKFTKAFSGT